MLKTETVMIKIIVIIINQPMRGYHAMRCIATTSHLSVCLSVCPWRWGYVIK